MDQGFMMDRGLPAGAIVVIVFGAIIGTIVVVFWIFLIVSCCLKCKNIHDQTTAYHTAPVVVTSATHTAPGGYPVTQMPVGATTTAYQTQTYAVPYPPQGAPTHMPMPMPMPAGQYQSSVQPPYPVMPSTANMNPPSYDVAVSGVGAGQPNNTVYQKQAPYNPNYQM